MFDKNVTFTNKYIFEYIKRITGYNTMLYRLISAIEGLTKREWIL